MTWNELFPKDRQPMMEDIAEYVGPFESVWRDLLAYFETDYNCKPKMAHSVCGMAPGWNLKFQKSNVAFGTWYPKPDAFDVMFVWSHTLDADMRLLVPTMTPYMAEQVTNAADFYKTGRYMMFCMDNAETVADYKRMCAVKKIPIIT